MVGTHPSRPDVTQLKALSHPVRMRILGLLRTLGPATASQVARRLGLNSGATSYHLRQLAEHGFVEEAPGLGDKRERWWQAASMRTYVFAADEADDDGRDTHDAYHQLAVTTSAARMQEAAARRGGEDGPWRDLNSISDMVVAVTAEQAEEIQARFVSLVWQVVEEYPVTPGPTTEGQRRYAVIVASFPTEDEPGWDSQ